MYAGGWRSREEAAVAAVRWGRRKETEAQRRL